MHWVVQENLYKEDTFADLIRALEVSDTADKLSSLRYVLLTAFQVILKRVLRLNQWTDC